MGQYLHSPPTNHGENTVLDRVLKNTAAKTGVDFFRALVLNMADAMNTRAAWVTELMKPERQLRTLAFWAGGHLLDEMIIDIDGTPHNLWALLWSYRPRSDGPPLLRTFHRC